MARLKSYTKNLAHQPLVKQPPQRTELNAIKRMARAGELAIEVQQHGVINSFETAAEMCGLEKKHLLQIISNIASDGGAVCGKVINHWLHLTEDEQESLTISQIARRVNVRPTNLFKSIVRYVRQHREMIAELRSALALPDVVAASAANATDGKGGLEDRKIILKHHNYISDAPTAPSVVIDQRQQLTLSGPSDFERLIKGQPLKQLTPEVIDVPAEEDDDESFDGAFD